MEESKLKSYERVYNPGDVIYEEGNVGDSVFLINSGEVEVTKGTGENQRELTTFSDGKIVGEMALEKGEHKRTATVRALTEVTGWRFPGTAFESLIEQNQSFRQKLVKSLIERLMETTDRLAYHENSELEPLNRRLLGAAKALMAGRSPDELETQQRRDKEITLSKNFLAYHFDASLDMVDLFLSLDGRESLEDIDGERRVKLSELTSKIIDELLDGTRVEESVDETDAELVEAASRARKLLNQLEDHSRIFENKQLQEMMETRKDLKELLQDRKSKGRDGYLLGRLAKMLKRMKEEINLRYD
ncbi:MAG: cyclic nucleotide-binding domain-containing protein [bacterium]